MNKKEFTIYLHKPHLIDKHAEIALQEVVTDFPYFHAAQQLLLKAHQNNGRFCTVNVTYCMLTSKIVW